MDAKHFLTSFVVHGVLLVIILPNQLSFVFVFLCFVSMLKFLINASLCVCLVLYAVN